MKFSVFADRRLFRRSADRIFRQAGFGRRLAFLALLGPGLISGFADNDAGGIATYSIAGAKFGYALMWVLLASMLALVVTQEAGARMGLATGTGLTGLIRERYGVRWTVFAVLTMLAANLGTTVAEFAGIGAALALFGVPVPVSATIAAVAMIVFLARGRFKPVQYVFLIVGIAISIAYAVSAYLAHPDWGRATVDTVVPRLEPSNIYVLAVMGTVGTTITPWGQSFIQSYVVDKRLRIDHIWAARVDVTFGSFLTNLVAAFILVACAATLYASGHRNISDAADAARALGPLAGQFERTIFGVGLLAASLLGLGTVPLTSAYSACEAFGWETGLDHLWREAPAFYILLAFFVVFAALFIIIPGLPLFAVLFLSQVFDGLLLPIVLIFVMLLSSDRRVMGSLASGTILKFLGWGITVSVGLLSVLLVATYVLPVFK